MEGFINDDRELGIYLPNAVFFFLRLYLFLERGEWRAKHQCVVASHVPPAKDLACNPGMGCDWEVNL